MKRMSRFAALIAVVTAISLFGGCSSAGDDKLNGMAQLGSIVGDDSSKSNQDPVTLTFYFRSSTTKPRFYSVMDEIQKRLKGKLNIKLDFKFTMLYGSGDDARNGYNKMIQTKIASGEEFEAFYYTDSLDDFDASSGWYLNLETLVKKGMVKDLSGILPKYAPGLYGKYSSEELKAVTFDGKLAVVPSLFHRSKRICAIVRKDLMEKYGIQAINNMDDYEGYLKMVHEKDPDLVPISSVPNIDEIITEEAGYVSLDDLTGLMYKWDDSDMKLVYCSELPEYGKYTRTIDDWTARGYFLNAAGAKPERINFDDTLGFKPQSPMPASFLGYPEISGLVWGAKHKSIMSILWNIDKEIAVYPLFPDKTAQMISPTHDAIAIPSTAKYPEKTLEFLDWVQSDQENYDLLMYGILGKDYSLYGKQYVPLDSFIVKGWYDYINWPCSMPFWNDEYVRTCIDSSPDDLNQYKKITKLNSKYPPHAGFCPDYAPVDRIINRMADESLSNEEISSMKLEIQRQLNEWRKSRLK